MASDSSRSVLAAAVVVLLPTLALAVDNVVYYVSPRAGNETPWLISNALVTGTPVAIVAHVLWFLVGAAVYLAMRREGWGFESRANQAPARRRAYLWLVGALAAFTLLAAYSILERDLAPLFQRLGIDALINGEQTGEGSSVGNYAGYNPTLAFLSPIIVGGAEEIVNVGIIALLSRRYGRGWGFILAVSALVRGVIHLHHGSLAILLAFLPLSVFAVAFFRTTAMVSPLVVGHMLWNFAAQAIGAIGQSLAREIAYPLVTYLLPLATVGLLVVAILRACGWQTSRRRK